MLLKLYIFQEDWQYLCCLTDTCMFNKYVRKNDLLCNRTLHYENTILVSDC